MTVKFMLPLPLLELGANLLGDSNKVSLPPVGRRAMHVVEIAVGGNRLVDGVAQIRRPTGARSNVSCTGRGVAAVMVSSRSSVVGAPACRPGTPPSGRDG